MINFSLKIRQPIIRSQFQMQKMSSKLSHAELTKTILNMPNLAKNQKETIAFFNNSFKTYLSMDSIKPVATFLQKSGVTDLKTKMNDHMAFRAPNEGTGIRMIEVLIHSGLYKFEPVLDSNSEQKTKPAINTINISNGNQYGVTLVANTIAKEESLPNYIFLSMNLDSKDKSNLYKSMNKPFKLCNDIQLYHSNYWIPAEELTSKYGSFFANHYALLVTEELLKTLNCHNIFELRELFLKNGFQENTSLSIRNCTDITQLALQGCGDGVYLEYIQRNKDQNGKEIKGFSHPDNIKRIGAHAN